MDQHSIRPPVFVGIDVAKDRLDGFRASDPIIQAAVDQARAELQADGPERRARCSRGFANAVEARAAAARSRSERCKGRS